MFTSRTTSMPEVLLCTGWQTPSNVIEMDTFTWAGPNGKTDNIVLGTGRIKVNCLNETSMLFNYSSQEPLTYVVFVMFPPKLSIVLIKTIA